MNLLFISMSARIIRDTKNRLYLNAHLSRNVICRYAELCDNLHFILRDSGIVVDPLEASTKYEKFPDDLAGVCVGYNPYSPMVNIIRFDKRRDTEKKIESEIKWADKIIISSATGIYTRIAINYCRQHNKKFLLMVGGFGFETDWNHGWTGKIVALKHELEMKKNIKSSEYTLYVTEYALQERYPCAGRTIGISDVEIEDLSPTIITNRIEKIKRNYLKDAQSFILGTAAKIDDPRKGHSTVLKALKVLKDKGIDNISYELLGAGDSTYLRDYAKKLGISEMICFKGSLPHSKVYEWYDSIDLYVQPSYTEGLCRAVVEAMSRGCPVICTDVGGNKELCGKDFLIKKGDSKTLANKILSILKYETQIEMSEANFNEARRFINTDLDVKRKEFLMDFINS